MFEVILSTIFLIIIIFLFLRMIFLAIEFKEKKGIFVKIANFFVNKTDFLFKNFDSKIRLSIGKFKLNYLFLILLLMLVQKLILLIFKNG